MARKIKLIENTEVFFDDLTHTYLTNDDRKLSGVTGMMKEMGVSADYGGIPAEVLQRAAERGTAVHKAIETWCKKLPVAIDPEYADLVLPALEAFKRLELPVLANEYLVSDNIGIASSIDMVLDDLTLVDIKTTSKYHIDPVSWQLSIYKYLFELQNPKRKVKDLKCLHWNRDHMGWEILPVAEKPREWVVELIQAYESGCHWTNPEGKAELIPTEAEERAAEALMAIETKVVALKEEIEAYETEKKALIANVMEFMKSHNIKKWELSERLSFTYTASTTRLSLDGTRLKVEQPTLYNQYLKESAVKESLKINIK